MAGGREILKKKIQHQDHQDHQEEILKYLLLGDLGDLGVKILFSSGRGLAVR
jgi:hypothetical protein